MAERKGTGRGSGGGTGTLSKAGERVPGTDRLKDELENYVQARLQVALEGMGHRLGEGARKLSEAHVGPRGLMGAVAKGGKKLGDHLPSGVGALTSTASHAKDTAAHAKDAVVDKAKDAAGQLPGQSRDKDPGDDPDSMGKGITIIEDIDVGVPVREAYDQWTQFQEFDRFAKGVVGIEQQDDTTARWHVKVAKSNRRFRSTITEQVPDERIAWTSSGDKGTTQGVVTFHPLTDNLTKVLLVLRYFPKGPVERVGSWMRAQGRRARLDLKLFRTFVMMRGEATGGWRGEIREGEVVREPEEVEEAEREEDGEDEEGRAEQEEYDDDQEDQEDDDRVSAEDDDEEYDEEDEEDEDAEDDWEEDEDRDRDQDEDDDLVEEKDREPDDRYDDDGTDDAEDTDRETRSSTP
ncbi:SRPBCC family protein [Streptomyces sp. AC550_RSS872]|uniref:SRPBCC family protein n=1 Tax=Streptomyces sp. AC550_RSS872 TaxID=2823689 RepID=UPI001C25DD9F|nr:SRPBCC family protein [Streptomyces sp. AC550_RSS872]